MEMQINPELTAIALTYKNPKFIAEEIFPKVPVETTSFQYREYDENNYFTIPETKIGIMGRPNTVEFKGKLKTASVEDHALEELIPISREKENKNNKINSKEKAVNQLTSLLKTRKEIVAAGILADVNSYGGNGGNVKTLVKAEKINNDEANAVKIIQTAADSLLYAPNVMVTSRAAMSALKMNPYIVDACGTAAKKAGLVTIEAIKELFGLEKILVGESVHNTAKKGQNLNLQPCWGNNISLLYINKDSDTENGLTFGFEAIYDDIQIGEFTDGHHGTKGVNVVKAFYSSKFLNICANCGYLLKDVLGS